MSRLTRSLVLSLLGLAIVAGPAAPSAAAGVIDYGAIAKCHYTVTESSQGVWNEALFKKLAVLPPTIAKTAGTSSVGWRFLVGRSLNRANGPWQVTYRSPVQHAESSAGLTPMRVVVIVPPGSATPYGRDAVWYRVTLKMFWYGPDGSVQNKVSHQMTDMHVLVSGDELIDSYCAGLIQQSA